MTAKSIPKPLYPCCSCYEDYSWPAENLFWSEPLQNWCCDMCWDEYDEHWTPIKRTIPLGISLAEELRHRDAPIAQP